MKAGDIVHFKKERTARYGKEGGTYEYRFEIGDRFIIEDIYGVNGCLGIKSMEDGTSHFITDMHEYLAGADEWREMALKQIGL